MDNKNIKVTFGLQPHHIETIENEFKRWQDMPPLESFPEYTCRPKYIKAVWDDLGRKLGWCPFTLALYYFRYLEDKGKEPLVDTWSKDMLIKYLRNAEWLLDGNFNTNVIDALNQIRQAIEIVTRK